MRSAGVTLEEAEKLLCKESGLKALSGGYNDLRDIEAQAAQGHARAKLAFDVLAHQARHWIGSFFIQLNGADALVFTAGIGENRAALRHAVCRNLDQLGILLDPEKNDATQGIEAVISAPNSRVKIMVIPANEELVVAREVKRFLESQSEAASPKHQAPGKPQAPGAKSRTTSRVERILGAADNRQERMEDGIWDMGSGLPSSIFHLLSSTSQSPIIDQTNYDPSSYWTH